MPTRRSCGQGARAPGRARPWRRGGTASEHRGQPWAGACKRRGVHGRVRASFCVLAVAPRYSASATDAGRDARSVARDLREVPRFLANYFVSVFRGDSRLAARLVRTGPGVLARVAATSGDAFLLLLGYTTLLGAVAVLMHLPQTAMLLVGGAAYLAGAAHIGAAWRVACVMSGLENGARGFRAMHASDELLTGAGKFWAAAALFTTLDGFAVAVQLAFGALVVDDRMGLGIWLRVAVGAVLAAALWTAVVTGLVAQVVVYFVCKSSGASMDARLSCVQGWYARAGASMEARLSCVQGRTWCAGELRARAARASIGQGAARLSPGHGGARSSKQRRWRLQSVQRWEESKAARLTPPRRRGVGRWRGNGSIWGSPSRHGRAGLHPGGRRERREIQMGG